MGPLDYDFNTCFGINYTSDLSASDNKYTNIELLYSDIERIYPHSLSIPSSDWTKSKGGGEDKVLFVFQVSLMELEFGLSLAQPLRSLATIDCLLPRPKHPKGPIISQSTLHTSNTKCKSYCWCRGNALTPWPKHVFKRLW